MQQRAFARRVLDLLSCKLSFSSALKHTAMGAFYLSSDSVDCRGNTLYHSISIQKQRINLDGVYASFESFHDEVQNDVFGDLLALSAHVCKDLCAVHPSLA
jgi:hypothetical protein